MSPVGLPTRPLRLETISSGGVCALPDSCTWVSAGGEVKRMTLAFLSQRPREPGGALSGVLPAIPRLLCPCNWAQRSGLRPGLCPHVPAKMSREAIAGKKRGSSSFGCFLSFMEKKKKQLIMIQPQIMTKGNWNIALLKTNKVWIVLMSFKFSLS